MLKFGLLIALLSTACSANRASNLLCDACTSDADCGGNPCFQDISGMHYCGAPCDACPAGFSCQGAAGSAGQAAYTCFPDNNSCAMTQATNDMATSLPDLTGTAPMDLAPVACTAPAATGVTQGGGTVDRLFFGFTGDTRPAASEASYPAALQTIIDNIFTQMGDKGVQFAVDQGDHLEASNATAAATQMGNYLTAAGKLGRPVFMTMGNHECSNSFNPGTDCSASCTGDFKCKAFLDALGGTEPYYRFDVMTQSGLAVFIVIADDTWNATQQAWLTTQLTDADAHAKYTFVSKHHPEGNTDQTFFADIENLVRAHKYTLFLTGHSHEYKREYADPRAIVMGLGGAPFDNPSQMFWGYGTIMQCPDDRIYVNIYDQASGNVVSSFNVPPQ